MKIDLHIEELILDGFPPGDRHRIGAAVERELTRLFTERGLPPGLARGSETAQIDGGSFEAKPGGRAEGVGGQVAKAVYGKIKR
ncbi:MAG TPA: hypothetical protein VFE33_09790 [Thermoanaerobaculia bacterium]|nr:hypothetical protein [Thermoanaerobaculia bacterium]